MATAGGHVEVYLDGGIRRGTDVLKALALGARAVLVGRVVFWGPAADAQPGLTAALTLLRDELGAAMRACGLADVGNADPSLAARVNGRDLSRQG